MKAEIEIKIKKIIVHILDLNMEMPLLSDEEHPLESDIVDFIEGHIIKMLSDEGLRSANFKEDSVLKELFEDILRDGENYIKYTSEVATMLYNVIIHYPDIPSADLVCCLFEADGVDFFGILKFNYKNSYIHYVNMNEDKKLNSIIKQKTTLPGDSQKVDECIIVNLQDFSMKVNEKKYDINGEEKYYLSSMFLDSVCQMSKKEKAQVFKKAVENFGKKHLKDDIEAAGNFAAAVTECIERNEVIDIAMVAENTFKKRPEMKQEFIEHIENTGIEEKEIELDRETANKVFKKHRIKTDSGIEITLPYDFFKDRNRMEFINNPDGTVSIMIKNIAKITNW
jgi:nucleoid-associated protein YejK